MPSSSLSSLQRQSVPEPSWFYWMNRLHIWMRQEKKGRRSFLYITHDPEEVLAVADQAAFMENGVLSPAEPVTGMDEEILASRAYGIRPGGLYERARAALGEEVLRVESPDISFGLRQGEVAALLGDSATAQGLLSRIGGLFPMRTGTITVNGKKIEPSPLSAVENRVCLARGPSGTG